MDGRDIGTCVLPEATVKIYLTASVDVRAKRRYDEYVSKGFECTLEGIKADVTARDHQDMTRDIAPLKQAEDAIVVDSSDMTIEQVVKASWRSVRRKDAESLWKFYWQRAPASALRVKRAVDQVYELAQTGRRIYTFGNLSYTMKRLSEIWKKKVFPLSQMKRSWRG